jgi:hypothetical protein
MSDKVYRWLIVGVSIVLAVGLGLFLGKTSFGQKSEHEKEGGKQLVLAPNAYLPVKMHARRSRPMSLFP